MSSKYVNFLVVAIGCALLAASLSSCKKSIDTPQSQEISNPDYDTYVFLGIDSRMDEEGWKTDTTTGTEGAPSSDVIMILTIEKESKAAKIISVYRDTMLDVSGDGSNFEKCNTAYREGKAYGAIDMLEKNLDLHIDGYVSANFMTVANAIDLLGGVSVDVEDEKTADVYRQSGKGNNVVEVMNYLIDEMNRIYEKETPHIEKPGEQILSGLQAVAYSRVRYTSGFDIERTERQRNVVALMAQKLKETSTEEQQRVLKQMYKDVDTDLTESELMDIFNLIVGYDLDDLKGFPYMYKYVLDRKKGYMYVPCDLKKNVAQLHFDLYEDNTYIPSATVRRYDSLITDETNLSYEDAEQLLEDSN